MGKWFMLVLMNSSVSSSIILIVLSSNFVRNRASCSGVRPY
jgi:hypothetical protein